MQLVTPEVRLIVPDFTISVFGSSCNYLIFGGISFFLTYLFLSTLSALAMSLIRKRKERSQNEAKKEIIT